MSDDFNLLLNKAYELHVSGNLSEAKILYEKCLSMQPDNPDLMNLYAQLLVSFKAYDIAIDYFYKVFELTNLSSIKENIATCYIYKSDYISALNVLNSMPENSIKKLSLYVFVYKKLNDTENAIKYNKEILKIAPQSFDTYSDTANLLMMQNKLDEALTYALKAHELNPESKDILLMISNLYEQKKDKEKVIYFLEKILEFDNQNELICYKIALMHKLNNNYAEAYKYFERVLSVNPKNIDALNFISQLMTERGILDSAEKYLNMAKEIDASNMDVLYSESLFYEKQRKWDQAITVAKKIIELYPESYEGYFLAGNYYYKYVGYQEALDLYQKALALKNTNDPSIVHNIAGCLSWLGKKEDALFYLDSILENNKNDIETLKSKNFLLLSSKKYYEAKDDYIKIVTQSSNKRFDIYIDKAWHQENIKNKTLLVYNKHGFGDFFFMARYIPYLKNYTDNIVIEVVENLYDFVKYNFPGFKVVCESEKPYSDFDISVGTMELLYYTDMNFDNIPSRNAYLSIGQSLIDEFGNSDIFKTDKLKVGIFWRGNQRILQNRIVDLYNLIPLLELKKCKFYSLDITDKSNEEQEIIDKYNIYDLKKHIKNFSDTAAILKNLDIVISVDSSILNLAGAMNVKAYMMLPRDAEWRWFDDTETTPWYESVSIFRQKQPGHWNEVILRIKNNLEKLMSIK